MATNKKILKKTILTVGGKDYALELPFKNAKKLERVLGGSILKVLMNVEEDLVDFDFISATIRFALAKHNGEMTEDEVDDLIQDYIDEGNSVVDLMTLAVNCIQNSGFLGSAK